MFCPYSTVTRMPKSCTLHCFLKLMYLSFRTAYYHHLCHTQQISLMYKDLTLVSRPEVCFTP